MKKLLKRFKESKKGFSLVELIVVIAIMAILVGVLGVTFIPYIERSREGMDIDTLGKVKSVVEPVMLTSEDLEDLVGIHLLSDLMDDYTIIKESLPNGAEEKCTCGEDLECYVYVDANGNVTAYFAESESDGATVFKGTKSGELLSTDPDTETFSNPT